MSGLSTRPVLLRQAISVPPRFHTGGGLSLGLISSHWVSHQSPRKISVFGGVGSGGVGGGHGFTGPITNPRTVVKINPVGVTGVPEMVKTPL